MEKFAACFESLEDPRTGNAGLHNFLEILMIALCSVLCGCETAVDMSEFGLAKETFLRQFLKLKHGIPNWCFPQVGGKLPMTIPSSSSLGLAVPISSRRESRSMVIPLLPVHHQGNVFAIYISARHRISR